jgi:hypothetical protein
LSPRLGACAQREQGAAARSARCSCSCAPKARLIGLVASLLPRLMMTLQVLLRLCMIRSAADYPRNALDSPCFVPCKCSRDIVSYDSAALNLGSCPHPEL